jgi:hypothetical protein
VAGVLAAGVLVAVGGLVPIAVQAAPAQQEGPPPNDNFADAAVITEIPYQTSLADISGATVEEAEPPPCFVDVTNQQTVWYKFVPQSDVTAQITLSSSGYLVWTLFTEPTPGGGLGALERQACDIVYQSYPPYFGAQLFAGQTYYLRIGSYSYGGGGGSLLLTLQAAPPPEVYFDVAPMQPATQEIVEFRNWSRDPLGYPLMPAHWDFGDGTTAEGGYVTHQYLQEGVYTVTIIVTTSDGRSATASKAIIVENHDVAITKFTVPQSARVGQVRGLSVGVTSKIRNERVRVTLYRSWANQDPFEFAGELTKEVPVGRTVSLDFSYKFTESDAQIGKVTFKAVAEILGEQDTIMRDLVATDNTALALPTKVSGGKVGTAAAEEGLLYLPVVTAE